MRLVRCGSTTITVPPVGPAWTPSSATCHAPPTTSVQRKDPARPDRVIPGAKESTSALVGGSTDAASALVFLGSRYPGYAGVRPVLAKLQATPTDQCEDHGHRQNGEDRPAACQDSLSGSRGGRPYRQRLVVGEGGPMMRHQAVAPPWPSQPESPVRTRSAHRPEAEPSRQVPIAAAVVFGVVIRVAWLLAHRHLVLAGDPFYYHHEANLVASGYGFIAPTYGAVPAHPMQTAVHPPLYVLYLALWSLLGARPRSCGISSPAACWGVRPCTSSPSPGADLGGDRVGVICGSLACGRPQPVGHWDGLHCTPRPWPSSRSPCSSTSWCATWVHRPDQDCCGSPPRERSADWPGRSWPSSSWPSCRSPCAPSRSTGPAPSASWPVASESSRWCSPRGQSTTRPGSTTPCRCRTGSAWSP